MLNGDLWVASGNPTELPVMALRRRARWLAEYILSVSAWEGRSAISACRIFSVLDILHVGRDDEGVLAPVVVEAGVAAWEWRCPS